MWPGNQADSYAPTSFFGRLCNTMSSCLGLLCRCLGHQREPTTPLMAPPPSPVDDRRHPQSSFKPGPPGPMDNRLAQLGGPHSPFGSGHSGPTYDGLAQLGGPHSPFGVPNPPGHNPFGSSNPPGPLDDAPRPPGLRRPPIKHRHKHKPPPIQHGYPIGPPRPPEPPRVPGVQPGLL